MKPRPFRFRLARVLRVREVEEESLRAAWGAAERDALLAEQRSADARIDYSAAQAELARMQAAGQLAPGEVLAADRLLAVRTAAFPALTQRAAAARGQAEARRDDWLVSRRERHSLETYRDRALLRHREVEARAESAAMDEVASTLDERKRRLSEATAGVRSDSQGWPEAPDWTESPAWPEAPGTASSPALGGARCQTPGLRSDQPGIQAEGPDDR